MPLLLTGRGGHVLKVVATAMGVRELVYSNAEAQELSRRKMMLGCYLMWNPLFSRFTQVVVQKFINVLGYVNGLSDAKVFMHRIPASTLQ